MKAYIERAHSRDADHVLRLVEENQLTTDGLLDHLATMLVARLEHRVVGTAALEIHTDGRAASLGCGFFRCERSGLRDKVSRVRTAHG